MGCSILERITRKIFFIAIAAMGLLAGCTSDYSGSSQGGTVEREKSIASPEASGVVRDIPRAGETNSGQFGSPPSENKGGNP
jgi:hypothetical protein